jgi:hypothetical protein
LLANNKNLTSAYLFVQKFELDLEKDSYMKQLLNHSRSTSFLEIDAKNAEILKGLRDYQETNELPCEVTNFEQAEAIARSLIEIHDQLEKRSDKYAKYIKYFQSLKLGVDFRNNNFLIPNTTSLIKAQVYNSLREYTNDVEMNCKLLEKSIDARREYRRYIEFGDIKTGFDNELHNLHDMVQLLKLKVKNFLWDSKLVEIKDQCIFAGKLFVKTVDLHHAKMDFKNQSESFQMILELYKSHKLYYKDHRDPDLVHGCSRLIAKLVKTNASLGALLTSTYELKSNWKKMSEQKLAKWVGNLEFKQQ